MTVIPVVNGALGTIPEEYITKLGKLRKRGQVETMHTRA